MFEERMAAIRAARQNPEKPEKETEKTENEDLKDLNSLLDAQIARRSAAGGKIEKAFTGSRPVKINAGG